MKSLKSVVAAAALSLASVVTAQAAGPFAVETGSYELLGRDEPLVATDRKVDLWAQVYRPKDLGTTPAPLLVFLHGNHATCGRFDEEFGVRVDDRADYTWSGACPDGYVVTPNHLGYAYLAEELASWGYIVVSINANRGITAGWGVDGDRGLNLMRGRLVLRHLALLSGWNKGKGSITPPATLGFDPKGKFDFDQVGFMGHSRGGEGVRAALQQLRHKSSPFRSLIGPVAVKSIFEIAPVDGQTDRVLDANGVNSIILLPSCDGDVIDLEGMRVFDRVFSRTGSVDQVKRFHGTIAVWGTNHNAYNTEWLLSDSPGCIGTDNLFVNAGRSIKQQATALNVMVPFFRATVGKKADLSLANLFDPTTTLPKILTDLTSYDRGYLSGPINSSTVALENFTQPTGTGDSGLATSSSGVTVEHKAAGWEHDSSVRVANVKWEPTVLNRYFQVNLSQTGRDLSSFKTFAFRVALQCFSQICTTDSARSQMNFTVVLVQANGNLSNPVSMSGRTRLGRPIGTAYDEELFLHSTLYTVAIPFEDFGDIDLTKVTGVRFVFQKKGTGDLDISNLTASILPAAGAADKLVASADGAATSSAVMASAKAVSRPTSTPAADGNRIAVIRGGSGEGLSSSKAAVAGPVSVVLKSKRSFPMTGAFPSLTVGDQTIRGGNISADGKTITFSMPEKHFAKLPSGGAVSLAIQANSATWKFGALPK